MSHVHIITPISLTMDLPLLDGRVVMDLPLGDAYFGFLNKINVLAIILCYFRIFYLLIEIRRVLCGLLSFSSRHFMLLFIYFLIYLSLPELQHS